MDNAPLPPADWYADPSGAPQLRYWDGAAWTEHVAPPVGPTGAAQPVAPTEPSAPSAPGAPFAPVGFPPRQKVMTRGTWVTLITTVVIVGGALGALGWSAASTAQSISAEAPAVLNGFLETATRGDDAWRDYAAPGYGPAAGAPLYGDSVAAEAIGLAIEYEVGELSYAQQGYDAPDPTQPTGADSATAPVDFTYTFSVDGVEQTVTVTRMLWLTRAFYFGDDVASGAREDESPTAVGPWQVAAVVVPDTTDLDTVPPDTTTYEAAPDEFSQCPSPESVLTEMSEIARVQGFLGAVCLSAGDRTGIGEDVSLDALVAGFPVLNYLSPPKDTIGLGDELNGRSGPLSEYRIIAGDTEYVFVFAATGGGDIGDDSQTRVISIQIAETE
ncbi:DUF2510 domain-containing protein [Microbacterium sp. P04]|uniref:DUF2510 domain-containing protein n=1 Tax=Microbacterium sp. P04 TaxID=3366947 RepID=UPI0037472C4A